VKTGEEKTGEALSVASPVRTVCALQLKINFVVSSVMMLAFLGLEHGYTGPALAVAAAGAVSSAALAYLVLWLLLFPFRFTTPALPWIGSVAFVLLDTALIADYFIYRLYRFHINGMVLNILLSPAAFDNLDLGTQPIVLLAATVALLGTSQWLIVSRLATRRPETLRRINGRINRALLPLLVLLVVGEKLAVGVADLVGAAGGLGKMRAIPFYQPLTFNRLASRLGFQARSDTPGSLPDTGTLRYPLEPISIDSARVPPNIFLLVLDSVRDDMITPEGTPNVHRFSQDAVRCVNHYSSGNSTRFGIFGLFYGIDPRYWFAFLNAQRPPVLLEALEARGYEIGIFSSANLDWPEFRRTVFASVPEAIRDRHSGKFWRRDAQVTEEFVRWLESAHDDRPLFGFLFLDAPHQYSYPRSHARFRPDGNGKRNYLTLDKTKDRQLLFNQYRNAIHYVDDLLDHSLQAIRQRTPPDRTVIIVTADHGEEFDEAGAFGHNGSFSDEQTKPPFFLQVPGEAPRDVTALTSHLDVPATLLSLIGVTNDPGTYSMGQSLLARSFQREYAVVASWNSFAIVTQDRTLVFSAHPNPLYGTSVHEKGSYQLLDEGVAGKYAPLMVRVMEQNRRFLQ